MHVRAAHVTDWLARHEHWILGTEFSQEFNESLIKLPWRVNGIRWTHLPHLEFEIPDSTQSQDFWNSFHATPAGGHEFTFLLYGAREPGIACRTREALPDLDLLYSGAPGARYFCGADLSNGTPLPRYDDFAEYDGNGLITAYTP
ncbi:hypothetical protein [Streptomyces sp. NPDC001927]